MKIGTLEKDLDLLHSGKKPTLKIHFRNEKSFNDGGDVMTTPSHQQSRFSDMDSMTKKSTSYNGGDVSMTFTDKVSDKVSMEASREALAPVDKKNSNEMKPKKIPSKLSNCLASLTDNESSSISDKSDHSEKSDGDLCPERRKQISFRMSSSFDKNSNRRRSNLYIYI
jgi:hypothetical protein